MRACHQLELQRADEACGCGHLRCYLYVFVTAVDVKTFRTMPCTHRWNSSDQANNLFLDTTSAAEIVSAGLIRAPHLDSFVPVDSCQKRSDAVLCTIVWPAPPPTPPLLLEKVRVKVIDLVTVLSTDQSEFIYIQYNTRKSDPDRSCATLTRN